MNNTKQYLPCVLQKYGACEGWIEEDYYDYYKGKCREHTSKRPPSFYNPLLSLPEHYRIPQIYITA